MEIYGNRISGYTTEYYSAIIEDGARKNRNNLIRKVSDLKDHILLDHHLEKDYNWVCKK